MVSPSQMSKIYSSMQISTSSNPANICMLHSKCTSFLKQALQQNQEQKRLLLNKVQNIIAELQHALKIEDDLSRSLFYIYDYCYGLLETTETKNIENTLSLMTVLRDTFEELLK
jgi:flagellar biosynthetic protein FliS